MACSCRGHQEFPSIRYVLDLLVLEVKAPNDVESRALRQPLPLCASNASIIGHEADPRIFILGSKE